MNDSTYIVLVVTQLLERAAEAWATDRLELAECLIAGAEAVRDGAAFVPSAISF